jgi:tricorn protease
MGAGDMATFVRDFYAQYDRDGLIIDVRRNRGGNIDSWVIEKLLRRAWAFWQPPRGAPYTNMQDAFRGHLTVLADQFTYSDGETFAAGVKALELGPVIGMRTSGAGIWLSDRNRLSDNGLARVAEFGQFDLQGRWLIEARGVAPDIEVDNLPYATAMGGDAQLDAALAYLERKLQQQPIAPLKALPIPPRPGLGHDGSR